MFSSDVSARGMDYPDVTAVVQVGMPQDKAQYIHRIGRTGRAGKAGGGYLLLAEEEAPFLKLVKDLPITRRSAVTAADPSKAAAAARTITAALSKVSSSTKSSSYQAWLGFYNTSVKRLGWDQDEVVRRANLFSSVVLGLETPPTIEARTAGKMGLSGARGLNIGGGGGGGGRQGGGGGGGKGGGKRGGKGG
eukprot:2764169-Prymnesium_polylepis.1